ncbi:MAG: type IV pilus biogenesis/stability protein PilW [Pseudomonadota bacterium]
MSAPTAARTLALLAAAALLAACSTGGGGVAGSSRLQGATEELKTASDQTSDEKRASIRMQLAVGYYQDGNYTVALDNIKQALQVQPDLADAYSVRALIYTAMGEMALAEENHQRAVRLAPRSPDLANNYGSFLCQTERYAQGMTQFELALKDPMYRSPVKALINAGSCSLKMKNYDAAERYLLEALRLEPEMTAVHANLAGVYYARRNYPRAGFFINRLKATSKLETLPADVLWLAIRVDRKMGERAEEASLVTQLRRRFPLSPELAAYQRGAFDE